MAQGLKLMVMLAAAAVASEGRAADALRDPTRPPAWVSTAQAERAAAPAEPVLQSVLISPQRRAAIISGRTVEVGGRVGDARLTQVSESGAVLTGPEGRRVLKLFPGVEKRPAGSAEKAKVGK